MEIVSQGPKSRITYSVIGDDTAPSFFSVHPTDGDVIVRQALTSDAEGLPEYQVRVVARDQGEPQRSSSAIVKVTVERNRYKPVFLRSLYPATISRTFMPGRTITTVEAADNDGQVRQSLSSPRTSCTVHVSQRFTSLAGSKRSRDVRSGRRRPRARVLLGVGGFWRCDTASVHC